MSDLKSALRQLFRLDSLQPDAALPAGPVVRIGRWLGVGTRPEFRYSLEVFLRFLGWIGLVAFVSLWTQIDTLAGVRGIAPAAETLGSHLLTESGSAWFAAPTLVWLNPSDTFLHVLCGIGTAVSVLIILDIAPGLCLLVSWVTYLSLIHGCSPFLSFQWDALYLEVTFLAMWVAPWRTGPGRTPDKPPPRFARWLLWWLLFRVTFPAGVLKLSAGGETWSELTALAFHFETQPLPHVGSWYAHQLSEGFLRVLTAGFLASQLVVPFCIFAPRRLRHLGAYILMAQQSLLLFTGNFGFFNLLVLALCLTLIDDLKWRYLMPTPREVEPRPRDRRRSGFRREAMELMLANGKREEPADPGKPPFRIQVRNGGLGIVWCMTLLFSLLHLWDAFTVSGPYEKRPVRDGVLAAVRDGNAEDILRVVESKLSPFLLVNRYGLLGSPRMERREIIIEGSMDRETWLPYEFAWKPGNTMQAPFWAVPHMPRIDWIMWYASTTTLEENPWFPKFMARILDGEPSVVSAFAHNPFPIDPPQALRAVLYEYRFSTHDERTESGVWWVREEIGHYAPEMESEAPLLIQSHD